MKMNSKGEFNNRRDFLAKLGVGALSIGFLGASCSSQKMASTNAGTVPPPKPDIHGFETIVDDVSIHNNWQPVSDRKIKMGLVGYGVCNWAAQFFFQSHPNVEVVAVSDLDPERCAELARVTGCSKTYPSLEELVKDKSIEAVFVGTDAPSHFRHAKEVLAHGKHVAVAVPAVFGSLDEAHELFEIVKKSGLKYMMYETSCFHEDLYAMRQIYKAGGFGKIMYSEGEYFHYMANDSITPSYKGWREGIPAQWYPTHSNAYHLAVSGETFTEVSCIGVTGNNKYYQPRNNRYKNPYCTEIALFKASDGGTSRMAVSWDSQGPGNEGGRLRGTKGSYYGGYNGDLQLTSSIIRPPLPPGVQTGSHGGSHGHLTEHFVRSILMDTEPWINIELALNLTVAGIVAHESAMKGGELLKIPQFRL